MIECQFTVNEKPQVTVQENLDDENDQKVKAEKNNDDKADKTQVKSEICTLNKADMYADVQTKMKEELKFELSQELRWEIK